jgi:hypothetical protein
MLFPSLNFLRPIGYSPAFLIIKICGMRPQLKKKQFFDDSDHTSIINSRRSTMPADSPEVLYQVCCDKVLHLNVQLNKLNLLEHPCEIQSVCAQLIELKKKLETLAAKHKMLRKAYP